MISRAASRRSPASRFPFRASALRLLTSDRKVLTARTRVEDQVCQDVRGLKGLTIGLAKSIKQVDGVDDEALELKEDTRVDHNISGGEVVCRIRRGLHIRDNAVEEAHQLLDILGEVLDTLKHIAKASADLGNCWEVDSVPLAHAHSADGIEIIGEFGTEGIGGSHVLGATTRSTNQSTT